VLGVVVEFDKRRIFVTTHFGDVERRKAVQSMSVDNQIGIKPSATTRTTSCGTYVDIKHSEKGQALFML
jgi:hypothetical protein